MVPHPYYKLKHGIPSAIFLPTCLRIPPIFHPCSAHFPPVLSGSALMGEACTTLLVVHGCNIDCSILLSILDHSCAPTAYPKFTGRIFKVIKQGCVRVSLSLSLLPSSPPSVPLLGFFLLLYTFSLN